MRIWTEPFEKTYIAHRGLFDNDNKVPENSVMSFQKAIQNGYGIELDVRLTKDDKLVVFHDDSLKRMCGVERNVSECRYQELLQYPLLDSKEQIPLFEDVLRLINGSVSVIVELKAGKNYKKLAEFVGKSLANYNGAFCVESFMPMVLVWFRKHYPKMIRGQLFASYPEKIKRNNVLKIFTSANLLLSWYTRPDFLAYNHKDANLFPYRIYRRLFHTVHVGWTIRSQHELEEAKKVFSIIIFDGFFPK